MTPASLTPVAVETTFTPPDCRLPPTLIEVLVIVRLSVGSARRLRRAHGDQTARGGEQGGGGKDGYALLSRGTTPAE